MQAMGNGFDHGMNKSGHALLYNNILNQTLHLSPHGLNANRMLNGGSHM